MYDVCIQHEKGLKQKMKVFQPSEAVWSPFLNLEFTFLTSSSTVPSLAEFKNGDGYSNQNWSQWTLQALTSALSPVLSPFRPLWCWTSREGQAWWSTRKPVKRPPHSLHNAKQTAPTANTQSAPKALSCHPNSTTLTRGSEMMPLHQHLYYAQYSAC